MLKIIAKDFEAIWTKYCNGEVGWKILDKEEFSSNKSYPMMWGHHKGLGLRVLFFFLPVQMPKRKFIQFSFVSIDDEEIKNDLFSKEVFPKRISCNTASVRGFHLSKKELGISGIHSVLEQKCKNITEDTFIRIFHEIKRVKSKSKQKKVARSVYTISGGLYGLGKNRRH